MEKSYLHSLPEPALQSVLRRLSAHPGAVGWQSFISSSDILTSLHPSSVLRPHIKPLFIRIDTASVESLQTPSDGRLFLDDAASDTRMHTWVDTLPPDAVEEIALGPSVRKKYDPAYGGEYSEQAPFAADRDLSPMLALTSGCVNLRKVDLRDVLNTSCVRLVLASVAGMLKELRVRGENESAISDFCEGLVELDVEGILADDADMWRTVGPTLRTLTGLTYDPSALATVKEHCHSLEKINVHITSPDEIRYSLQHRAAIVQHAPPSPDAHISHADFLCAYGPRLKSANLYMMPASLCRRVVTACPNVRVQLDEPGWGWPRDAAFSRVLPVLGERLTSLCMRLTDQAEYDLDEAVESCPNIESLQLIADEAPDSFVSVSSSFARAQNAILASLAVSVTYNCEIALDLLARATGTLREFRYSGVMQPPGAFRPLGQANPALEEVYLSFRAEPRTGEEVDEALEADDSAPDDVFIDLVESFCGCADGLRELCVEAEAGCTLTDEEVIARAKTACARLRIASPVPYVRLFGVNLLG